MKSINTSGRWILLLLLITTVLSCRSNPPKQETEVAVEADKQPAAVESPAPASAEQSSGTYAVYGNWCGPDHPLDSLMANAPGPIDQLDGACMIHDYCYAQKGYTDCGCDEDLTNELKRQLASNEYSVKQSLVARGIHDFFIASPCKQSQENAQAKSALNRSLYRVYDGVKRRVTNAWDWATNNDSDEDDVKANAEK